MDAAVYVHSQVEVQSDAVVKETGIKAVVNSRRSLVAQFLTIVISKKMFSVNYLKRLLVAQLKEVLICRRGEEASVMTKPNGLSVKEMFDGNLCQSGDKPVHSSFNMVAVDEEHVMSCAECSRLGRVDPQCYFFILRKTLTHGWKPPISAENVVPAYGDGSNHRSVYLFKDGCQKVISRMVEDGVLKEVRVGTVPSETEKISKTTLWDKVTDSIHRGRRQKSMYAMLSRFKLWCESNDIIPFPLSYESIEKICSRLCRKE